MMSSSVKRDGIEKQQQPERRGQWTPADDAAGRHTSSHESEPLLGTNKGGYNSAEQQRPERRSSHSWLVPVAGAAVVVGVIGLIGASTVLRVQGKGAALSVGEGMCSVDASWYQYDPTAFPDSIQDPVTNPHLFQGFETGWQCGGEVPACPVGDPAAADTPADAPEDGKAHLFFIGDSTDKLNFHAACNLLLPPLEQCDYHCTNPALWQFPRNVRQHLSQPALPNHSCCDGGGCCMSESMVSSSPACVPGYYASGLGAVGDLHTCGSDDTQSVGCNGVQGGSGVPNVYSADGLLPDTTSSRISTALQSFYRWTTETVGMKPRPVVVIIQSALWDLQPTPYALPRGSPSGDPLDAAGIPVAFDDSNADFTAFLQKYTNGLRTEYQTAKSALESVGVASDCIAFRTSDMFGRAPVASPSRRELVDRLNGWVNGAAGVS